MKPPILIHIGKPKCASTFLQKEFFPKSNFKYVGKPYNFSSDEKSTHFEGSFDYSTVKKCLNKRHLQNQSHLNSNLHDLFTDKEIILSDELITCSILINKYYDVIRRYGRINSAHSNEALFFDGVDLGVKNGKVGTEPERYDTGNIISSIAQLFGREISRILLIERDFGEWMCSFFLQFYAMNNLRQHLPGLKAAGLTRLDKALFNRSSLMGCTGFALGLEKAAIQRGVSYGIYLLNTKDRIHKLFPNLNLDIISHNKNPSTFKENIFKVASHYGINKSSNLSQVESTIINSSSSLGLLEFNAFSYVQEINELASDFFKT